MPVMNKEYKLSCDLFLLDYKEGNKILYAPRLRFVFVANPDLQYLLSLIIKNQINIFNDQQIEILEYLESKGVLNQKREWIANQTSSNEFKPLSLTLFPTNRCNLRCIYCYASAGDFKPMKIRWIYARSAIDFVIKNLIETNNKTFPLGFHGGGEPLYEWNLIKKIVEYAEDKCKENNLEISIGSATNGVLSPKQLEWIIEHFYSLTVSFDGNIYSQNFHRPLSTGKGSFKYVDRTLKFLDCKNFRYGIRSTISAENIDQMEDIMNFILQNYKCNLIQLEPISNTGRCVLNNDLTLDLHKFAEKYVICEDMAIKAGVQLTYSGCKIDSLSNIFCGISNDCFAVTPDGYIATCFEVTSKDDPRSEKFFVGRIDRNGKIFIDESKRDYIKSIKVNNIDYCNDCFAKWHCAGECITRLGHDDYLGPRGHDRCQLNRELLKDNIIKIIEFTPCISGN
jgi:uncharacterized protein